LHIIHRFKSLFDAGVGFLLSVISLCFRVLSPPFYEGFCILAYIERANSALCGGTERRFLGIDDSCSII
jgi:hypothetical protein